MTTRAIIDMSTQPAIPADTTSKRNLFPIIGVGASAGGLEALELFLSHVPTNSGMAFVIIQHMDRHHKSVLPELLQRITSMSVFEISDRMRIKPNCVYVNPPNKDVSISLGTLSLVEVNERRVPHLAIDFFFHSLALDRKENAVAIVLSGMGSDGTRGIRAIKEHNGLTLVQEPSSAKFDSMPSSVILAKLADIVAIAEQLPDQLIQYLSAMPSFALHTELTTHSDLRQSLDSIVMLLHARTGNDFARYKKTTLYRRIERRMSVHQIQTTSSYVNYLTENPQEVDLLFKELLIGVTNFFRDAPVWEHLKTCVIPELFTAHTSGKEFRAWVPACSTGEEAYSLAIIFAEAAEKANLKGKMTLRVFATDLDQDAVHKARIGIFPASIAEHVSAERLARYFIAEENGYRICKEIRERVIFAVHNIIRDAPFTKLDFLTCRNLMIYLGQELQNILLPVFHYALHNKGILLLGSAETIGGFNQLFAPIENKLRIFQRLDSPTPPTMLTLSPKFAVASKLSPIEKTKTMASPANLQQLVDQLLLKNYTPAAVLINIDGDILYVNGSTGKYLEPAAGKANWNIHVMAREGLRYPLMSAIQQALKNPSPVQVEGICIGTGDGALLVNITVQLLKQTDALAGKIIVLFTHANNRSAYGDVALIETGPEDGWLWDELQQARAELQTLREEIQSTNEELQSTNEEMQSTNEEMQSTNEELTTSKEEMQSMNEELHTMNVELQSKVDDLSLLNNDMKNLLNSTEIATVFLNAEFCVRRFTPSATRLFKLLPHDVGRQLSDIVSDLDYPDLLADAQEVLNTLIFSDKPVMTHDKRWFSARIMPYRTQANVISGVVMTFTDITIAKTLEIKLREALKQQDDIPRKPT